MKDLQGKVVLITGAGGGFGQQMIRQFLQAGCRVVLTDINAESLSAIANEIAHDIDSGQVLDCIEADLSSADGCEALFQKVRGNDVCPDILVNNAGIAMAGRMDLVPAARWEALMQIDLMAPMRLCTLFMPGMIARGSGHIVNISSIAGWLGAPGLAAYNSAKFGLRGFGEGLQEDLREFNVQVSTVYPWFSRTPILQSERYGLRDDSEVPANWVTEPEDVVAAIIQGVRKDKHHIFPDKMANRVQRLKRYAPFLLRLLTRRIDKEMHS